MPSLPSKPAGGPGNLCASPHNALANDVTAPLVSTDRPVPPAAPMWSLHARRSSPSCICRPNRGAQACARRGPVRGDFGGGFGGGLRRDRDGCDARRHRFLEEHSGR
ncbi:exported hypothetical protein [Cupriavidus neocaledonicus]|uniref:Uncharacterized protein n=1 Tax=Cupriavidus neocaledonicus TaxID=1040979 RepID=A0ABY1VCF4_9BURK|nr:exported hypothetical protein [Cupriavidus neocaledonicus]